MQFNFGDKVEANYLIRECPTCDSKRGEGGGEYDSAFAGGLSIKKAESYYFYASLLHTRWRQSQRFSLSVGLKKPRPIIQKMKNAKKKNIASSC